MIDWSAEVNPLDSGEVFNMELGTATIGIVLEVIHGFENVIGLNYGCTIIGNGVANYLPSGHGNDILNGAGVADIMLGGDGNDVFCVNNNSDVIGEITSAGDNDRVIASVDYVLTADTEIERLLAAALASATAIDLTGYNRSPWTTGTNGVNLLSIGDVGPDTLTGLDGADINTGFSISLTLVSNAWAAVLTGLHLRSVSTWQQMTIMELWPQTALLVRRR